MHNVTLLVHRQQYYKRQTKCFNTSVCLSGSAFHRDKALPHVADE
jgi:hypothetical protein